jgi:predicted ABC-type ATPase
MPQLWVVAGPNGAGKTTLALTRLAERIPVVNPDMIASLLPRIVGKLDEREAGARAIAWRNRLLADHEDFAVETTLAGHTPLKLMRDARAAGFKVTLVYIGLASATLSASRVLARVRRGGHAVPLQHIERRYPDTMSKLGTAIIISDRAYVFDNSGARRRLLLNRDSGRNKFVAAAMPAWAKAALEGIV